MKKPDKAAEPASAAETAQEPAAEAAAKPEEPAAPEQAAEKLDETAEPASAAGTVQEPVAEAAAKPEEPAAPEQTAEKPAWGRREAAAAGGLWRGVRGGGRFVWRGAWRENPVLVHGLALAPILGAAFSLKNGVLLSAAMLISVLFEGAVALPVRRLAPRFLRPALLFAAAAAATVPVCLLGVAFAPSVAASCGIYLPLAPVCALPVIEKYASGPEYKEACGAGVLLPALRDGAGFAVAALLVSALREILGLGTLYDRPLFGATGFKIPLALLPCGTFILLACLIALFSALGRRAKGGDAQ